MSAPTELSICNLALQHIGQNKVTDVMLAADTDPSSVALNSYFDVCRDDVFREHRWPFAVAQDALVTLSSASVLGWGYVYEYPTQNAASVNYVFNETTVDDKQDQDFEVQYLPDDAVRVICSNCEDAYMEYTHIITDTSLWDPKFVMAFSYRLAAAITVALTGDAQKALSLTQMSNAIIAEAKRVSFAEQRKKPKQTSSYQNSR